MKKKRFLLLILLIGIHFSQSAFAWDWIKQFYGDGCRARWNSCLSWVKKTCGGDVGGCNGSCVFGISGDCEADDYQLSQLQNSSSAPGTARNTVGLNNQRKNAPSRLKYSDMTRDPSAVRGGNYQFVERGGKVINKSLSTFEAKQLGIVPEQGPRGRVEQPNKNNPSY